MTTKTFIVIDKTAFSVDECGHVELNYNGTTGTLVYDAEDYVFIGKVTSIQKGLILYEGRTINDLVQDFQSAVDEYVEDWLKYGKYGVHRVPKDEHVPESDGHCV